MRVSHRADQDKESGSQLHYLTLKNSGKGFGGLLTPIITIYEDSVPIDPAQRVLYGCALGVSGCCGVQKPRPRSEGGERILVWRPSDRGTSLVQRRAWRGTRGPGRARSRERVTDLRCGHSPPTASGQPLPLGRCSSSFGLGFDLNPGLKNKNSPKYINAHVPSRPE